VFFSFEGIDGAGKTTQVDLFCRWLRASGREVVTCRDPGSTPLGEKVREILLASGVGVPISRRSEMLLYMAARAQLVDEIVAPALAAGKIVVSDRFLLANVVYQGHAGGLDVEQLREVGAIAVAGTMPDLVFLLDADPALAAARLNRPLDRMEDQGEDYRRRLRDGYLTEARRRPDQIAVLDASRPAEEIHAEICKLAEARLA